MPDVTPLTTSQEVTDIVNYYTDPQTGLLDESRFEADILNNVETAGSMEDLIIAFIEATGGLTDAMMAPESHIPNPEDPNFAHLWEADVIQNLETYGDLKANDVALNNAIDDFIAYGMQTSPNNNGAPTPEESDLFNRIDDFIENDIVFNDEEKEDAEETLNLFNPEELQELMAFFIAQGNTGFAITLHLAFSTQDKARKLQEAALEILEDGDKQLEDLLDDLEGVDPESADAQTETQMINQKIAMINQVSSTIREFIKQAQDAMQQEADLASRLSSDFYRQNETIIRNIG